jgi:hypothetical protein
MLTDAQGWWLAIGLFALTGFLLETWWHRLQMAVFALVLCSNIYWAWTPNKMLAGLIGAGMAFLATLAVTGVFHLAARCREIAERRRRRASHPVGRQSSAADWPRRSLPE